MTDIIVKDRIYIRKDLVDRSELKRIYVHQAYKEDSCQKCPSLEDRHSHVCDECPAYLGLYELYNKKKFKDKTYYGISLGKRGEYKEVLKDKVKKKKLEVKDLRCNAKMKHKIKFTGTLTKQQIKPVNTMTKKDYGILESPARSGKTVMMTAVAINKGKRTLVLAAQTDWLSGFYETICGSKTQKALTNVPKLEKKYGYPICVFAKKYEDFVNPNHDIVLVTYQTFLSKRGQKLLKKIVGTFGTIMVDECLSGDTKVATGFNGEWEYLKTLYSEPSKHKVLSYNHSTKERELKSILGVSTTEKKTYYEIELEDGSIFKCSAMHEFWSNTRNEYVMACDLQVGEDFMTLDNSV
ncbi:MAG: DEAD/DEAH box helicase family protein [Balneolaceae bacterium]